MRKLMTAVAFGIALHAQAEDPKATLAKHQQAYEQEIAKAEADSAPALKALADEYFQYLKLLEQKSQQAGDLNGVLMVRKEKDRFTESKRLPEDAIVKEPKSLADLQAKVFKSLQALELKKNKQVLNSATRYLAGLEELKKSLTKVGQVDDAVGVNSEIDRVKQRAEIVAARQALASAGIDTTAIEAGVPDAATKEAAGTPKVLPPGLKRGLMLYYAFDRNEMGKVADKSGKSHTGRVHGAKWIPKGKIGGAYEFNGRGDYIDTKANFSGMDEITVCGWSFLTKTPADSSIITQYGGSTSENVWSLFSAANGKGAEVNFCPASGGDYNFYGNAYELNKWKHLCVTYARGKAVTLYENGLRVNSVPVPDSPLRTTANLTAKVAASQGADGYWGSGVIDEVMIFDRALSGAEVKQLYEIQK